MVGIILGLDNLGFYGFIFGMVKYLNIFLLGYVIVGFEWELNGFVGFGYFIDGN